MKRTIAISIILLPIGYLACLFLLRLPLPRFVAQESFSDHPTIITHKDEWYHIIPENKLGETLTITDQEGKKYYILSEQKLRLLGPELLSGD